MSFLNIALLGGVAALAIPLIIHLLNRSRFRKVDWGAMHLLETVVASNSRRVRFEQLLLLLIRCAIPALLAFCLARPVLTGWQALPGDAPSSTVILLDNSYSMDAPGHEATRFAEAMDDVRMIVRSLGNGSDVALITTGGSPQPLFDTPVFDPQAVVDGLQFLGHGYGATSWNDSLDVAVNVVAEMANSRRNLVVVSDFQKRDIDAIPPEQLTRLADQIRGLAVPPQVSLLQRTGPIERNVAVDDVELSAAAIGAGQQLKIRVRLKNYGRQDAAEVRVTLKVDSQLVEVSEVDVASGATAQVFFVHQFDAAGSRVVEVVADAGDNLSTDDRYVSVVDVIDRVEVLLIDGVPSREAMKSETDFLSVALTPFSLGRVKLADLVETRIAKTSEVSAALLQWARVVVMANVSKLEERQLQDLAEFVRRGGGLMIFAGDQMNLDWYNRECYANARLLPRPIQGAGGNASDVASGARIVSQFFEHPALQIFNQGQAELSEAEVQQWYVYAPSTGDDGNRDASDDVHVLMRLDNGDPFVLEKTFGKGLVLAFATSADADWTSLPLRPVFVPLIQQLVTNIATRGIPAANLTVGDTIVSYDEPTAADSVQVISLPNEKRVTVRPVAEDSRSLVRFEDTLQPGIYTLTTSSDQPHHFAVETDRQESDVASIDNEQLQRLASELGADVVSDGQQYVALEAERRHGREVWRAAMAGFLGLMLIEMFLQQRFARVRT